MALYKDVHSELYRRKKNKGHGAYNYAQSNINNIYVLHTGMQKRILKLLILHINMQKRIAMFFDTAYEYAGLESP